MKEKKHLYFVPGLAANPSIFDYIKLANEDVELHYIEWLIPESLNETLEHYVKRMAEKVQHKNAILIGVSFGGVVVQEMKKLVNPEKVIIISSIKNKYEMPKRMHFAQKTNAHKIIPTKLFSNIEKYEKFVYGDLFKNRVKLYKKFLSMRDELYLPWSIHAIVNWDREETDPDVIHIHGTNDFVFPSENIKDYIPIEEGTHIMILDKAKLISPILEQLIL